MLAAGEAFQHFDSVLVITRLAENVRPEHHDGIRADHQCSRMAPRYVLSLFPRQALRVLVRALPVPVTFVDVRRDGSELQPKPT